MGGVSEGVGASALAAVSAPATPANPSYSRTSKEQTAVGARIRGQPPLAARRSADVTPRRRWSARPSPTRDVRARACPTFLKITAEGCKSCASAIGLGLRGLPVATIELKETPAHLD